MKHDIKFRCCPYFQREVERVIADSGMMAGLKVETSPFSCIQYFRENKKALPDTSLQKNEIPQVIIGGGCLQGRELSAVKLSGHAVLAPRQCFYLVAPAALVDSLTGEGAYLMTPGWLSRWENHLSEWGFNQEIARLFFRESILALVLLDTGVDKESHLRLSAMGEYLGLPFRTIPVGLDMLRLTLENLFLGLIREKGAATSQDRYFADHFMVIDLMNGLLSSNSEAQALDRVKELFKQLFAPGRLVWTPRENLPEFPVTGKNFAWTESGRGFVIGFRHQEQDLGTLELDDLAFVKYKERYLALALPLSKVCSLAIFNARAMEKRRNAQEAMRSAARIVSSSDDAIIGKTLDGVIVSWNQGAKKIYGYEKDDVIGKSIFFLMPPNRYDEMPRILEKIRSGQPADSFETVWKTRDGRLLNVSLQVSPILNDEGAVVGASSIARDITQEKIKIEKERASLNAQLQQSQKMESVGRLAGGVAHDFNNMLAIIMGFSDLILQDVPPGGEIRENLEEIQKAAERAKVLTRQLLAFARKQVLDMSHIGLNSVIRNFKRMIDRLIGEDIEVALVLADKMPLIKADPAMMEQILMNLAVNARDAMPDGGTLTFETRRLTLDHNDASTKLEVTPGDYVMLAVTDTGVGMNEETRQMIFEPFFTTKEINRGTGLGLSTVYGIVKQHGGSIWVYSEPGQGTVFKIYFPVSDQEKGMITKPVEEKIFPANGETILVVEDEKNLREFIRAALERVGYHVLCAGLPTQALNIAQHYEGPIHLMLTDVILPEMNGKLLFETLAPDRPGLKVVFMSGYTENIIARKGVLKEGIHFIQKPFSTKQLTGKLGAVLSQS